jgi:hypothetical protein
MAENTSSHQEALDIAEKLHKIAKERNEELKKTGAFTDYISGGVKKQQIIQSVINKDGTVRNGIDKRGLELAEKQLETVTDISDEVQRLAPGMFDFVQGIEEGVRNFTKFVGKVGFVVAAFATLVSLGIKFAQAINEVRKEFGLTAVEAAKVAGSIKLAEFRAKRFLLDSDQIEASYKALADTFGVLNHEVVQFSVDVARVARNSGLTAESTAELLASITAATGQSKDLALNSINTLTSFARLEGVAPSQVFKDLATNADVFASFIGRGEQNLIKAAAAARKVGLEFGSIVSFGDELLNITDRLEKEQTLSIITGRQIRLDRVAILTSQGRIAEAQRELATQLRAVQGLTAQQIRFAAQQVGMDVNALLKLVQLGESSLREQKKFNMNQMN